MRISDWSSDVCSSDLLPQHIRHAYAGENQVVPAGGLGCVAVERTQKSVHIVDARWAHGGGLGACNDGQVGRRGAKPFLGVLRRHGDMHEIAHLRSEEHTSELQSLMRTSYAVFCLKKKNKR